MCFADAGNEAEFLSRPWKYAAQFRPTKLPPLPPPVDFLIDSLPIRGYAEQTLGDALKAALTELAVMRPKHPTAGCRETALKFLAVYLRANNPRKAPPHVRAVQAARLQDFTQSCTVLDRLVEMRRRAEAGPEAKVRVVLGGASGASDANVQIAIDEPSPADLAELIAEWDAAEPADSYLR